MENGEGEKEFYERLWKEDPESKKMIDEALGRFALSDIDDVRANYEKWFAKQSIFNADLYKWGALWTCWKDAYKAGFFASKRSK